MRNSKKNAVLQSNPVPELRAELAGKIASRIGKEENRITEIPGVSLHKRTAPMGGLASEKYGANSPLHKIRSHKAGSTVPAGPTLNPPNLSQKEDSTVRLGRSLMDSSSRPFHLASSPSSNGPWAL